MDGQQQEPRAVVGMYSLFSPDPPRLGRFWSALMGLPVAEGASDELVMLDFDHEVGPVTWIIERRDEVAGGQAPLGLDIGAQDAERWADVVARAESLGATRIADNDQDGARWVDMADPDGNRFRVFGPRPV